MIRFFTFILLGGCALLLESTWLFSWPTSAIRFEFIWLFVLYLAFTSTLGESGLIIIVLGLMEDITGAPFLGFFAASYFLIFTLVRIFISHAFIETLWARLLWVGILTVFLTAIEWSLMAAIGHRAASQSFFVAYGLLQALLNMIVAGFLFPLLDRMTGLLYKRSHVT